MRFISKWLFQISFLVAVTSAAMALYKLNGNWSSSAKGFLVRDRLQNIPPRPLRALTGNKFLRSIENLDVRARDTAILKEIERGNIPASLRKFVPLQIKGVTSDQKTHNLIIWVMRDYLSIGSESEFVRVPLSLITAKEIADRNNLMLPTAKLVDDIYRSANIHLEPVSMTPGPRMASIDYILRHNRIIKSELRDKGFGLRAKPLIIAGHKKDVVQSNRLLQNPDRVAIYGWHRDSDDPIQPLSVVHGIHYLDYSHGIRYISRDALLNGKPVDLEAIKSHPKLHTLITYEAELD